MPTACSRAKASCRATSPSASSEKWGREASQFHFRWQQELEAALGELGATEKLKRVEHHLSHAANAYYKSGFDEALVVTLDGYGSGLAGSINVGRGGKIERLHGQEYPHSLGTFYESVTSALGFTPSRHEGKIVGLAAYGDPSVLGDLLRRRFVQKNGGFRIVETNNVYFARLLATNFPKIDVAAAYQRVLEEVATAYVSQYIRKTGTRNLVLSGGVVANVKLNQRLREIAGVEGIFIHPNMGDGGCGTGAALLEFAGTAESRKALHDVYLGPEFSSAEIAEALNRARLPFTEYKPIEPKVAMLLAAGKVVARFDGRMEYGPRALGHRSILYHAKEPAVNQWLNQRLGRTEFMPFAPATLYEHRDACYLNMAGRRTRGGVHDADVRLHRVDEARLPGRGARGRHRAASARLGRRQPRLPSHPDGVLPADGHSVGDQHELQHARGADRLHAGRRDPRVHAGQSGLPGDRELPGRAPEGESVITRAIHHVAHVAHVG